MSVRFVGRYVWEPVAMSEWTVDHWGMDNVNVTYRGSRDLKTAFENSIVPWHTLNGYPLMRAASWVGANTTPSFPEVVIRYIGFRSGNIPPVKIVDGTTSQSAQGSGIDTATGRRVSGTFLYRASRTSYIWFEKTTPLPVSKYQAVRFPIDPLSQIDAYFLQDEDTGKVVNSVPFSVFTTVFNSLIRKIIVGNYEREELIPNLVWGCRADVDFRVVN